MRIHSLLALIVAACGVQASSAAKADTAIFAAGCFWCAEAAFEGKPGVTSVVSGYTGGKTKNPTYEQVSAGDTGHIESIKVEYDPQKTSYDQLLTIFWHNVDPFDAQGQFCDKGSSYVGAIFPANAVQTKAAEMSKASVEKQLDKKTVTKIVPASAFYNAEDYHQNYYSVNPIRYKYYSTRCGRASRLKEVWGEQAGH